MQKIFTLLFAIFILTNAAFGQAKIIHLKKTDKKIIIDGIIENAWQEADSTSDFVEFQPYPNSTPQRKTVAKLLSTESSLYCLFVCYDDPAEIQANSGMLDERTGDAVSIMLDTFGDKRTAYKFGVSASGVRSDCRLLDDARNRDYSWDGIWFASSKIYSWGYAVEIEIPYKSIQYDEKLFAWGLDFDRYIPHLHEDIYWISYAENEGQRISKFGSLIFDGFRPKIHGLSLEVYPVGITKATYNIEGKYDWQSDAGLDIFYNPSPKLTLQMTFNPDFAQVEADPYNFNISRYESYFQERRPFFTEGRETFTAAGKLRNMGFYRPLELFYSRRIGKKLRDGSETPLLFGTKAFGRTKGFEYGALIALTGEKEYSYGGNKYVEKRATFGAARIKKQIWGNSSAGILFAGKHEEGHNYGVVDIDGAFRKSDWQLAYQIARSFKDSKGDFAISTGFSQIKSSWFNLAQFRYIGKNFDVSQIGFVPWRGSANFTYGGGPRWVPRKGSVQSVMLFGVAMLEYTDEDAYTDRQLGGGISVQFRNMAGINITFLLGRSKDLNIKYNSFLAQFSTYYFGNPKYHGNFNIAYSKTYNFRRGYAGGLVSANVFGEFKPFVFLSLGTSADIFIELKPNGTTEEITYNSRPFFSLTPFNNLNLRLYVDNVFLRSSSKLEQIVLGFLFSYNFSPKSWIYFAINEVGQRIGEYDENGNLISPLAMKTTDRAAVFKIKYLYYF